MPYRARIAMLLVTPVPLLAPAIARAADPAAAQALFDEGKQLMSDRRYEEACPKLEESLRLDQGIGTEFRLADCWQHLGRTASAWALFRQVESEAQALGQSGRERVAHDRASALGSFLSHIVVDVGAASATPSLTVRRDDEDVAHAMWGVPVPVDPGPHFVRAYAPGKQPWQTTVQVLPDGKEVRVAIPALADLYPPPPAAAAPEATPPPAVAPVPVRPLAPSTAPYGRTGVTSAMPPSYDAMVVENRGGFQRTVGWLLVAGGFVGLGTTAYFGMHWLQEKDATDAATQRDALTQRDHAEIALSAGGAALFLGTILVTTAPGPRLVPRQDARLQVAPVVGADRGGVVVQGRW